MCDGVDPRAGGGPSTECTPVYPWNVVWSFSTSGGYGKDGAIDDGPTVPPPDVGREISSMYGRNESKMVDLSDDARARRRRRKIAAAAMETIAILPTTPPAIGPAWLPE